MERPTNELRGTWTRGNINGLALAVWEGDRWVEYNAELEGADEAALIAEAWRLYDAEHGN